MTWKLSETNRNFWCWSRRQELLSNKKVISELMNMRQAGNENIYKDLCVPVQLSDFNSTATALCDRNLQQADFQEAKICSERNQGIELLRSRSWIFKAFSCNMKASFLYIFTQILYHCHFEKRFSLTISLLLAHPSSVTVCKECPFSATDTEDGLIVYAI